MIFVVDLVCRKTGKTMERNRYNRSKLARGVILLVCVVCCHVPGIRCSILTPKKCNFSENKFENEIIVNCSSQNLQEIPRNIPRHVTKLLLSNNVIKDVPNHVFRNLLHLNVLDLSYNQISHIGPEALSGLTNLLTLNLSHNKLVYNESNYPRNLFKATPKLRHLYLHGNNFNSLQSTKYPDEALSRLSYLQSLSLDGLNRGFGHGFKYLSRLTILNISGYDNGCFTETIDDKTFENLMNTSIKSIDMTACKISHISPNAFKYLTNLEVLTLNGNFDLTFEGVKNVTMSLKYTNISELNLNHINSGSPKTLKHDILSALKNTNIRKFDFGHNHIYNLDPEFAFTLPRSITYLSLSDNLIIDVRPLVFLILLANLKVLDVSGQLQLHHTQNLTSFLTSIMIPIPRNLEYLICNNNKLGATNVHRNTKVATNKLKYADFSSNAMTHIYSTLQGFNHLEFFNLSNNGILGINTTFFGYFENLRTLVLSYNHFGLFILQNQSCQLFSKLTRLNLLDLSFNNIKQLPFCIFQNLRNLKNLGLNNNALTGLDFKIDRLQSLELLDLSYNQLLKLSSDNMCDIDNIIRIKNNTLRINLKGNPLKCGCEDTGFLIWLNNHIKASTIHLEDMDTYACVHENGSMIHFRDFDQILLDYPVTCVAKTVILTCSIGFVVVLLLLAILTLYHYKRWKIQYLLHVKVKTFIQYRQLVQDNRLSDVYISHSDSKNDLALNLEEALRAHDYQVCVADGHGQLEMPGITNAIQESTYVVALITKDYVNDHMKTWEFNMAVIDGLAQNYQKVLPVLVERDIPVNQYDEAMINHLMSNNPKIYLGEEDLVLYLTNELNRLNHQLRVN